MLIDKLSYASSDTDAGKYKLLCMHNFGKTGKIMPSKKLPN